MSSALRCEACDAVQPADSDPSGFCCACAAPLRAEALCPWCARRAPAGAFCRKCGCGLVPMSLYGAARMLKQAGVDRLSLADRLKAMPPEQVDTFRQLFDEQRAVVERLVDEVRRCEAGLVRRHHSAALEARLFPALPLEEEALEALRGPACTTLADIEARSPLAETRALATIARFRSEPFTREGFRRVNALLHGSDDLAREAALGLAHWRLVRPGPLFASHPWYRHVADHWEGHLRDLLDDPVARPWARAALCLLGVGEVGEGLLSPDADLALTVAIAVGAEGPLEQALADRDGGRRAAALYALAQRGSVRVAAVLRGGSDDDRALVLRLLRPPLDGALVEPALIALEEGSGDVPRLALDALKQDMDPRRVRRVLPVIVAKEDVDALESLMRVPDLPEVDAVAAAVFRAGLEARIVYGLDNIAPRLGSAVLEALLVERCSCKLLRVVEKRLGQGMDQGLFDAVVRIVLGGDGVEVREEAGWVLHRLGRPGRDEFPRFRLSEDDVRRVFGGPRAALEALTRMLVDEGVGEHMVLREWVGELLGYGLDDGAFLADDELAFRRFVDALSQAVRRGPREVQAGAVKALWKLAPRGTVMEAVRGLGQDDLSGDITYWVKRTLEEHP